jgi:hypothetical protein
MKTSEPVSIEVLRIQSAARELAMKEDPSIWFDRHLEESTSCQCSIGAPHSACDRGEALFRVQMQTIAGRVVGKLQPIIGVVMD